MSKGAFAKISGAPATGGGNNIRDGVYKYLVEKVHMQDGHSGECFIAEFRVLDAQPNGASDDDGRVTTPNGVGSTCSMVCNITKHESAAGNAKAFVVAALAGLGVTEDKITPETMAWVCSEENPLRGLALINETYQTLNKGKTNPANRGKKLTLNKWKAITQGESDVLSQRAYLDGNPAKVDAAPTAAVAVQPAVTAAASAPAPAAPKPGGLLSFLGGGK